MISALVFYPWSALLPAAIVGAWVAPQGWTRRSAISWAGSSARSILLECFRTKLIHYYLPAFPSCALLVAWLILALAAEGINIRRRPLGRLSLGMLAGIGLALAAILIAGARWRPAG